MATSPSRSLLTKKTKRTLRHYSLQDILTLRRSDETPLVKAARNGWDSSVKALLAAEADVDATNHVSRRSRCM